MLPLRNDKITKYFFHEPSFNGAYSMDSLPRTKDGVYVINLDHKKCKETHWVLLISDRNAAVHFNLFGME